MDWIIGGTKDSRDFVEKIKILGADTKEIVISTVSEYGKKLAENLGTEIHIGAMDESEMEKFILEKRIRRIFDFSHPYAAEVSKNAMNISKKLKINYFRFEREMLSYEKSFDFYCVEELVKFLESLGKDNGNILVTLGSNNIEKFKNMKNLENIYFRVLPVKESIDKMEKAGIQAKNIIGLQGPFSKEFNKALYKNYKIRYVVTKESGKTGGELEKIEAALETGAVPVVLKRPKIEYTWVSCDIDKTAEKFIKDLK